MRHQYPKLHIGNAILKAKKEFGSYLALSELIRKTNANSGGVPVDRRKLKAIAEGQTFTVSLDELVALDNFFSSRGEGLGNRPLFIRKNLIEGLAENQEIVFLLGAFPRNEEERNDVSLWDVRAFREILTGVQQFREGIKNKLQDVFFLNEEHRFHNQDPKLCRHILDQPRQSVCSIGSMRSSVATEIILAEMFNVTPFTRTAQQLPFLFSWPADQRKKEWRFASAFVADHNDLKLAGAMQKKRSNGFSGLIVGGRVYEVNSTNGQEWDDYGVVAVQRKSDGRIWLVLAGISGVSTYAAAVACRTIMDIAVPNTLGSGDSPVAWAVVKAKVGERKDGIGDLRHLKKVELLEPPDYWPKPE